jgi:predicted permease
LRNLLQGLRLDLRVSLRRLVTERRSTLAIGVVVGLGIGPATAGYAAFHHLFFRPVPGVSGSDLIATVRFTSLTGDRGQIGSLAALEAMRAAVRESGVLHLAPEGWTVPLLVTAHALAEPRVETVGFVYSEYGAALGLRTRIGRLISDEEAGSGSDRVAMISEAFWRQRYDGSRDVIGQTLQVGGVPFVVVGVVDGFRGFGAAASRVGATDIWLPVGSAAVAARTRTPATTTALFAGLRPDADLDVIQGRLERAYASAAIMPVDSRGEPATQIRPVISLGLGRHSELRPSDLSIVSWSAALTGALMLVAAVNAGGLVLNRFARRRTDVLVRVALGAPGVRVIRQYGLEAGALVGVGALIGGLIAILLLVSLRGHQLTASLPGLDGVEVDAGALGFWLVMAAITGLLGGVLPTLMLVSPSVRSALLADRSWASARRRRHPVFLCASVALSTMLAMGAAVLAQSFRNILSIDVGARLDRVIELGIRPDRLPVGEAGAGSTVETVALAMRRAGFDSVVVSTPSPLSGNSRRMAFRIGSQDVSVRSPREYSVWPGFFDLMAIPLVAGRDFMATDRVFEITQGRMPVIVNLALAGSLFGGAGPVGQEFVLERALTYGVERDTAVVIGVVGDVREDDIRLDPRPTLYHMGHIPVPSVILFRSGADPTAEASRLEDVVRSVAPGIPIASVRPLRDRVSSAISRDRTLAMVSVWVSAQALLIAGFGVWGVVGQTLHDRRRELGIRAALGASGAVLVLTMIRGTLVMAAIGVVIGLTSHLFLATWLKSVLFALGPWDVQPNLVALGLVIVTATAAAVSPAWRAARREPVISLRTE